MSLETLVPVAFPEHTNALTHTLAPRPNTQPLGGFSCYIFSVQPAWFRLHSPFLSTRGRCSPWPARGVRTRSDGFERTVTFAQEQKVYFLTLCNKTTASGRSVVSSFVFYLCLFIDFLSACFAFATPLSLSFSMLRQVVERSNKKKKLKPSCR